MTREGKSPLNDEQLERLLQLALKGDVEALNDLFGSLRELLYATAPDGTDVRRSLSRFVQEALFDAFQNLGSIKNPSAPVFRAWLMKIFRRRISKQRREDRRLKRGAAQIGQRQPIEDLMDRMPSPETAVETQELTTILAQLMQTLTRPQEQVVRLYYFEKISQSEIAAKLKLSVDSVEGHLKRAKAKLRGLLDVDIEP